MGFEVIDMQSRAGGPFNDDRAGARGALAWVIDGATDIVAPPLTNEVSDAAWLATEMDTALRYKAQLATMPLSELPAHLAAQLSDSFARAQRCSPIGREEHPSAAAIVVRAHNRHIEYVSLGDCTLIAEREGGPHYVGVGEDVAGDRWAVDEIAAYLSSRSGATIAAARQNLWTKLSGIRALMNTERGYGIFSITPPPLHFVRSGSIALEPGARILLATDGLLRLVDVFYRYDHKRLLDAACARGLTPLLEELREIECSDPDCTACPRTKVSDDATGILLQLT